MKTLKVDHVDIRMISESSGGYWGGSSGGSSSSNPESIHIVPRSKGSKSKVRYEPTTFTPRKKLNKLK